MVAEGSWFDVSPRERRQLLGYAGVIVAIYLLSVAVGWAQTGQPSVSHAVLEPIVYPVLFFYAPPLLAAYNDFRGGSTPGSLLFGVVPGLTFPLLAGMSWAIRSGPADSPAWVLTLAFLAIGVVGAAAGIVGSRLARWLLGRVDNPFRRSA